jgi:para-nitrobenzyl esterase
VLAAANDSFRFGPIVDGWFLPKTVDDFAGGDHSDVATLTGWDADEGSFSDDYGKVPAEEFRDRVRKQAGSGADETLSLYPAATEAEAGESQKVLTREMNMVSMYLWATKHSKSRVYTYIFTHPQPGPTRERYLVFHSSELPYMFNNLDRENRPWGADDQRIAKTMSSYWVNFITNGDPNGDGLPEWSPVSHTKPATMELGDRMGMRPIVDAKKFETLKSILEK